MTLPKWAENSDLWGPLATVVAVPLSFVLVTVAGSIIGYYFQKRLFQHQKARDSIERRYTERRETFETLSKILDRRIYQYRQVIYGWWRKDDVWVEREFAELRKILFEWNGQINAIYGKAQIFFGPPIRKELEIGVMTQMRRVQRLLEERKRGQEGALGTHEIWKEIDILNGKTDALYRHMLKIIDDDALVIGGQGKRSKRRFNPVGPR